MIDQPVLGGVIHVQPQRQPGAFVPHRRQGIERHFAVGPAPQVDGIGEFAAAFNAPALARVVAPVPAGGVQRQGKEQGHRAVAAGGVGEAPAHRDMIRARVEVRRQPQPQFGAASLRRKAVEVRTRGEVAGQEARGRVAPEFRSPDPQGRGRVAAQDQFQPVAGGEPGGGGPAGRFFPRAWLERHALKQKRARGGGHFLDGGIIEPDLARVPAKEAVQGQRPDRFIRQQNKLALLPIMRAAVEAGRLAPERGAVRVENVHVERVAAVGAAADLLGLAPAANDEGRDVGPVERERLAEAIFAAAVPAFAHNAVRALASLARREAAALPPGRPGNRPARVSFLKAAVGQQRNSGTGGLHRAHDRRRADGGRQCGEEEREAAPNDFSPGRGGFRQWVKGSSAGRAGPGFAEYSRAHGGRKPQPAGGQKAKAPDR